MKNKVEPKVVALKNYRVLRDFKHNGVIVHKKDILALSDEEAAPLSGYVSL